MALRGLQALLALIEAEIRTAVPDVTFAYAKTGVASHGRPPRIAWVPTAGTFGPAEMLSSYSDNPRQIATDNAGIEVHCWAADDEVGRDELATALAHTAIAAMRAVCGPTMFELHANDRGNSDNVTQGWLYKFIVTFKIPVVEDEYPTAVITDMPLDTSSPPPDGVLQAPGDD